MKRIIKLLSILFIFLILGCDTSSVLLTKKYNPTISTLTPVSIIKSQSSDSNNTHISLNSGIITIILDDGNLDQYTNAFPIFKDAGIKGCLALDIQNIFDNKFPGIISRMSIKQIKEISDDGWEIMSHSMTHIKLDNTVGIDRATNEIVGSYKKLHELGFDVKQFVAPNSYVDKSYMSMLKKQYTAGYVVYASSANEPIEKLVQTKPIDFYALKRANMQGKTLDQLKAYVDYVDTHECWLIFYEHHIGKGDPYTTSKTLRELLEYIRTKNNTIILTGTQAVDRMSNAHR